MGDFSVLKCQIVDRIVKSGGTIFGVYVYKTLINGDESSDIDVMSSNKETLIRELISGFKCTQVESDGASEGAVALECNLGASTVRVDIVPPRQFEDIPTQWFVYDGQLRCTGQVAFHECIDRYRLIQNKSPLLDTLRREKDPRYSNTED